jgi:hypothetical protein
MSGKRARGPRPPGREPVPHGVLIERAPPPDPVLAGAASVVICQLLPALTCEVAARRQAGPKLTNTDGDPLKFITATVGVSDPAVAAAQLAAHPDFKLEEDGELTWWGRELTAMEQQSTLAQLRAQFGEDEPVENPEEIPRWLRGRLRRSVRGFEADVNSEQRLQALIGLLEQLGLAPKLSHRSAIDPPMDLPPIPLGGPARFGASQQAIDAWMVHWPDERVPAVGNRTPRTAARSERWRPPLEALLREFEHDASLLTRQGALAPDIDRLRAELGMERWWEPAGGVSR